ncbi:hypothetical protein Sfulv_26460 [Streptomyces fulvorobeus]|uniref:Uncharacterized protein n=1 Tax=Streptomyces fulvorobeus TaxID=284028 RepID=A0A7J0C5M3_9ACTN|nr:hypothetical protein Sfulv_26460 [Streptomyces fulvorobeus]
MTTDPSGSRPTRARHGPSGSAAWFTDTRRVTLRPAASVPEVLLRWSQGASTQADQVTASRPEAVRVIVVRSPEVRAVTARSPGPCRPPALITSAETSGVRAPGLKRSFSPGRALPAFS